MKTILILVLACVVGYAEDRDTIPLKNPTLPTTQGETTESFTGLTNPPVSPLPNDDANPQFTKNGQAAKPYIASVDTYGSSRINEGIIRKLLGPALDKWLKKGLANDETAPQMEATLRGRVIKKFGFPFAEWSVVQYFQPGDLAIHVTLDVVEKSDVAKRMPFYEAPTKQMSDPDNLIKSWQEYEDTALDLVEKGQLEPDIAQCAALHCPFGHKHPKLKKYESIFVEGVKKDEQALVEITKKDARPEDRASAAYLLAYLKDGNRVVNYEMAMVRDPDDLVRNNALRVLGDIAEFHPEYVIPAAPIVQAIHFPRVSDRSKALYVAFQMVGSNHDTKDLLLKDDVPDLIQMMQSKQPDHRDLSYGILRKISGKDFAVNDVRSWNNWFFKLNDRAITKK